MLKIYRRVYDILFLALLCTLTASLFLTWWHGKKQLKGLTLKHVTAHSGLTPGAHHKRSEYDVIASRNLFAGFVMDADKQDNKGPGLPETQLRLRLTSTILSNKKTPMAVIEDQVKRKQSLYKVGDLLIINGEKSDVRLTKIERFKVVLVRNGKEEVLKMFEKKKYSGRRPISSVRRRRYTRRLHRARAIPKKEPVEIPLMGAEPNHQRSLPSEKRNSRTSPSTGAGKDYPDTAKFYPVMEGNEVAGMRIRRIRAGSIYRKAGIIEGDVIKSVNGQQISGPSDIEALKEILKNREPLEIEIKRRGRIIKKELENY